LKQRIPPSADAERRAHLLVRIGGRQFFEPMLQRGRNRDHRASLHIGRDQHGPDIQRAHRHGARHADERSERLPPVRRLLPDSDRKHCQPAFFSIVGLTYSVMDQEADGRPGHAVLGPPPPSLGLLVRRVSALLRWSIRRLGWPTPFFDERTKALRAEPCVLTQSERAAL
jgi:hypothetical protein